MYTCYLTQLKVSKCTEHPNTHKEEYLTQFFQSSKETELSKS